MTGELTWATALQQAMQAQQRGNVNLAIAIYENLLQQAPDQVGIQHLLATAYQQAGRYQDAIHLYQQVIQSGDPQHSTDAWNNLGTLYRQTQAYDQAIQALQQALDRDPDWGTAWCNLALVWKDLGKLGEAEGCLGRALQLNADDPQAHYLMGQVQGALGHWEQAVGHWRRVLSLHPDHIPAHIALGNALLSQGDLEGAVAQYQRGLFFTPDHGGLLHNLGYALARAGRHREAVSYYWQALRVQPDYAEVHYNLGNLYLETGQLDLAELHYQQTLNLLPNAVDAWINWGNCALDQGNLDQALERYDQALARDPEAVMARVQRGFTWLLQGDLERGLPEYYDREWCLWRGDPPFEQPAWQGQDLRGKTLLVHCRESGGLGDVICWSRYLPLLSAKSLILETPPELTRLLASLPGVQVIEQGSPLPDFDYQVVFNQLPRWLSRSLAEIPPPCLPAPPPLELPPGQDLKIGLVWAGKARFSSPYRQRSLPLASWQGVFPRPGIQLYSLQQGSAAAAIGECPDLNLIDLGQECQDLWDTARAIQSLDLVISVDTAVAHLSGSLGKPTWVVLPYAPDWRWFLRRSDSPWYSSLRLFRQTQPGNWQSVLDEVAVALSQLTQGVT
ncbi:MAG: tetratricopeptide repeat protein [Thermostichales cyanobacterium BF4_bins_65]